MCWVQTKVFKFSVMQTPTACIDSQSEMWKHAQRRWLVYCVHLLGFLFDAILKSFESHPVSPSLCCCVLGQDALLTWPHVNVNECSAVVGGAIHTPVILAQGNWGYFCSFMTSINVVWMKRCHAGRQMNANHCYLSTYYLLCFKTKSWE